jgi:hypothetical protein
VLKDLSKFYKDRPDSNLATGPYLEVLLGYLGSFSKVFDRLFLVVDGLDECRSPHLLELLGKFNVDNVHLLVTSRDETDIREAFSNKPQMQMDRPAVDKDITVHIAYRMEKHPKLKKLSLELKKEIKEKLFSKCDGM